jgi:O-acetyl-ADP-ribose deacetylase (regulator of RNase III)
MPWEIIYSDLVIMKTTAIVNAANSALTMGGGVCGAIFRAAGPTELALACQAIGSCPTGEAVITNGFNLPAQYIIHTVGPVWQGGQSGEKALLTSCYEKSLKLAVKYNCLSIAFPLISAGIYGYPKEAAKSVAIETISRFLDQTKDNLDVFLVLRS